MVTRSLVTEVVRRAGRKGMTLRLGVEIGSPIRAKWQAPAVRGRGPNHQRGQLEPEDRRELRASRAAAAKERIADTDIAGRSDRIGARADLLIIAVGRKA